MLVRSLLTVELNIATNDYLASLAVVDHQGIAGIYAGDNHLLYLKADPEERKKALEKRKRIKAKFG